MAVCGLICSSCPIYLTLKYPELAKILVEDFKGKWKNVKAEDFHCKGCWGENNEVWTLDCEISFLNSL